MMPWVILQLLTWPLPFLSIPIREIFGWYRKRLYKHINVGNISQIQRQTPVFTPPFVQVYVIQYSMYCMWWMWFEVCMGVVGAGMLNILAIFGKVLVRFRNINKRAVILIVMLPGACSSFWIKHRKNLLLVLAGDVVPILWKHNILWKAGTSKVNANYQ